MSNEINFRIAKLMDERGLKPYPFAKSLGIASSTMTSIYKGKVNFDGISISTFLKIAHGLGMTAEELYYGTEHVRPQQPSITPNEQVIVDAYRLADEKQQRIKLAHARIEIEMAETEALEKKDGIQAG